MNVRNKMAQLAIICMSSHCKPIDPTHHPTWRELYLLALFEPDRTKANKRIVEAEWALVLREHELFTNPQDTVEREEINTALHSLQALRRCLGRNQSDLAA